LFPALVFSYDFCDISHDGKTSSISAKNAYLFGASEKKNEKASFKLLRATLVYPLNFPPYVETLKIEKTHS
jgi:hypothetical protein